MEIARSESEFFPIHLSFGRNAPPTRQFGNGEWGMKWLMFPSFPMYRCNGSWVSLVAFLGGLSCKGRGMEGGECRRGKSGVGETLRGLLEKMVGAIFSVDSFVESHLMFSLREAGAVSEVEVHLAVLGIRSAVRFFGVCCV